MGALFLYIGECMPLNKSALKRERQDIVKKAHNRVVKSRVHTAYRKLNDAIIAKNREEVETNLFFEA